MPRVRWRAVLTGLAVAIVVGYAASQLFDPITGSAATIVGIAVGGFLAGKRANASHLYHGALVGLAWILLETLGLVPTATYSNDLGTDTAILIAMDAAIIAAGAFGGTLSRSGPSSSSGTGTGR